MIKYSLLFVSVFTLVFGCKNKYEGIPNISVDIYINIQNPQYQNLSGMGSWAYIEGGSKGIIVFNSDNENFLAYERHCPYDSQNSCSRVSVDETNLFAVDSCCSSKYQLLNGSAIDGPASLPLIGYNTSFDGNIIHIWN
jgi:nitrite reductase/ring-hydroxylating ferredoxin subunit